MFSSGEMMTGVRLALSLLALAAGCCAQRTWVVDAKNGVGADFVDFPAALSTASPGDTISLRVGTYRGGVVSKGVSIRPETLQQAVFFSSNLSIASVPAGQVVHIKRVEPGPGDLRITNCRGTVRLEDVSTSIGPRLIVLDSAHVELSEAGADVPWIVERSHLQLSSGGLWAGNLPFAARIKDSTIIMVDAAISGKWGFVDLRCRITKQPGMAVHATNSIFVLAGSSGIWGGIAARPGFCGNRKVAPSIAGTNNVVWMDSKIVHNSLGDNPFATPTANRVIDRHRPVLRAVSHWPGGSLRLALTGRPNTFAVVLASLPAPAPLPVQRTLGGAPGPDTFGIGFALDPSTVFLVDQIALPTGRFQTTYPITKFLPPGLIGVPLTFQAAVYDAKGMVLSTYATSMMM